MKGVVPGRKPQTELRDFAAKPDLRTLETLTRWLDRRYLDPLLGLVLPGAGDLVGAALGLLGVTLAFRARVHPLVIARMLLNLAVDALLGALPFVGDLADVFFRAHVRNLELLKQRREREAKATDWLIVGAAVLLFVLALTVPIWVTLAIWRHLAER